MLNFKEFTKQLNEDFKSDNAVFFNLKTYGVTNKIITVFYERVMGNSFDLTQYMSSFNTKVATKAMNSSLPQVTRALVYSTNEGFLVFVWKTGQTHKSVANGLDVVKANMRLPNIEYGALYKISYNDGYTRKFGGQWVFPVGLYNTKMKTNITVDAFNRLFNKIQKTFRLNDVQMKVMTDEVDILDTMIG